VPVACPMSSDRPGPCPWHARPALGRRCCRRSRADVPARSADR
jgi:hypothetical protein